MRQVILIPDEIGGYVVEPRCYSHDEIEEEALTNFNMDIKLPTEDMIAAGVDFPDAAPPILPKTI